MIRSVAAVAAGFLALILTVMIGVAAATAALIPGGLATMNTAVAPVSLPASYLTANIAVSLIGAILGGWLTARLSAPQQRSNVMILAGLVVLLSVVTAMQGVETGTQPMWYRWIVPVIGVVGVLIGGGLGARRTPVEDLS
ncbi:MAG TPA: hypothetical protein VIF83_08730 [Gemmatimonadaceae bacterium]|jgi:hypothetical protein